MFNPKGYHAGSVLAMEDDMASQGGDAVIDMGGSQLATINHDQDQYYSSRADAMHTIESTIVELGGIFSQLATMVKEQEEMVTRIDNNIDDTALNVELGHNEILKWVLLFTGSFVIPKIYFFQVFSVSHIQPVADGQDFWSAYILLPPLCHLYGVSYLRPAQVFDVLECRKDVTLQYASPRFVISGK